MIETATRGEADRTIARVLLLVGLAFVAMLIACTFREARFARVLTASVIIVCTTWLAWRRALSLEPLKAVWIPLCAVVGCFLLSSTLSLDPKYSFRALANQHVWFAALFACSALWAVTPERQTMLLRGLAGAGVFCALTGIVLYYFMPWFVERGWVEKPYRYLYEARDAEGNVYYRAQSLIASYTRSAMVMVFALAAATALVIGGIRRGKYWEVTLVAVGAMFCAWYLLLTKSRGAWVGAALACMITFVLLRGRLLIPAIAGVVVVLAIAAMPSERARVLTLVRHLSQPDLFLSGRLDLWRQGEAAIRENLLFGIGYGQDIFQTDAAKERYPLLKADAEHLEEDDRYQPDLHQLYFQTLAEMGIVGSAAYLFLIGTLLLIGCRAMALEWKDPRLPGTVVAFACLITFLAVGVVYAMNETQVAQIAWTTTGMLAAAKIRLSA